MKVFKIEGYVLDPDDIYDEKTIQDTIEIDALANLRQADGFVKVFDRSDNDDKSKSSNHNCLCKDCRYYVPIENTAEKIFSGLAINANGFCNKKIRWINVCYYCSHFVGSNTKKGDIK